MLLQSGFADLSDGETTLEADAPALIWHPLETSSRLRVRAGSVGAFVHLGEQSLSNAIGRKPEGAEIRMITTAPIVLSLDDEAQSEDVARSFEMIFREGRSDAPGAETIVEAHVRVLLVILWRHATQVNQISGAEAMSAQILQRFRHQLEVRFRERLGVADYARLLGTSPDRLHDICSRVLGRPPLRLIHERTLYEAQVLLERSSRTIDQIAEHLGFRSAGQFSKFFKSNMGASPSTFRASAVRQLKEGAYPAAGGLADWP